LLMRIFSCAVIFTSPVWSQSIREMISIQQKSLKSPLPALPLENPSQFRIILPPPPRSSVTCPYENYSYAFLQSPFELHFIALRILDYLYNCSSDKFS
jgi:hypothetical protein